MEERWILGVDIGSVTVKFLLMDGARHIRYNSYCRTDGDVLGALLNGIAAMRDQLPQDTRIGAVGTTGSGRFLAGALLGADVIKNEITTHAVGVLHWRKDIQTIIEIGGQDSKIIHLQDGLVVDFAMNTVCAAGTGAFLDQQALRLKIPIETFGDYALSARKPVRIAGRCSVFAESDMIHKQQSGHDRAAICLGLCQALARNYLNNVARGKRLRGPISLQGGVAYNAAIVQCFREALPDCEIVQPPYLTACGAVGAALLAAEQVGDLGETKFRGWQQGKHTISQDACSMCSNGCEVSSLDLDGNRIARWGGRCDRGNALEMNATCSNEPCGNCA